MHHRLGVHHVLAVAVPRSVMLFHVFYARVLAHVKGMFAVVTGSVVFAACIVNTTACDDDYVRVLTDMEIVIHHFLQSCFADDNGDMHTLVFGVRFDVNINARFAVRFGDDVDIRRRLSAVQFPVAADIVRALGRAVQIGYFF